MPITALHGRFVCTAADPWTPEKADRATHPDAVDDGVDHEWYERYTCPHCGLVFKVELPSH